MGDRTTRLGRRLQGNIYINDRRPGRWITMDTSRLKIGRKSFLNRLNCLREVHFDWTTGICPHRLRVELKKTFIKQNVWHFTLIDLHLWLESFWSPIYLFIYLLTSRNMSCFEKFCTNQLSEIIVICINLATQDSLCGNSSLKDKWLLCCNRWSLWKIQIQTPRRDTWTSRCWWCSLYSLTVLIKESLINDHQLICLLRVQSECRWFDRMNICHNLFSLMFWPWRESNPGPWA